MPSARVFPGGQVAEPFETVTRDQSGNVEVVASLDAVGEGEELVRCQLLGGDFAESRVDRRKQPKVRGEIDDRCLRTIRDGDPSKGSDGTLSGHFVPLLPKRSASGRSATRRAMRTWRSVSTSDSLALGQLSFPGCSDMTGQEEVLPQLLELVTAHEPPNVVLISFPQYQLIDPCPVAPLRQVVAAGRLAAVQAGQRPATRS